MSSLNINKIDDNKLPIRYVLGIQEDSEDFPTALDILYIFISKAVHQPDRQKETFTKNALTDYQAKGKEAQIDLGIKEAIGKESYRILINPFI